MDRAMSNDLPVSVVVPCHNAAATLARAVESVAGQTSPPAEVILIDDASVNGTADAIAELARRTWPFSVRTARLPENRGPGEARNTGCSMVDPRSEYVAFLDADDLWLPEKLARQVGWMERHPNVGWTAHRCGVIGDSAGMTAGEGEPAAREITRAGLLLRNTVATPTVVVRATNREWFRPGWRWCEDLMLWIDWIDHGRRGFMLEPSLALLGRRPKTPGGSTGNLRAMHAGECDVIDTLVREQRLSRFVGRALLTYVRVRFAVRWVRR
jgi:glycosyltransferase involved in cell wall biosynthesis